MKSFAIILITSLLVACGGEDSNTGASLPSVDAAKAAVGDAAETAKEAVTDAAGSAKEAVADAAGSAEDAMAAAKDSATEAIDDMTGSAADDEQSASCLDLVGSGEFNQALPVCTAALAANPTNQKVQDALEVAKSKSTNLGSSTDAASKAATDALGGAMGK